MGAYVNPENVSKEEWLIENAINKGTEEEVGKLADYENTVPVCLVFNGHFTAAGIAYSKEEFKVFSDPYDSRPKLWFLVEVEKLFKVSPELKSYIKNFNCKG